MDNKTNEHAEWDLDLLKLEIADITKDGLKLDIPDFGIKEVVKEDTEDEEDEKTFHRDLTIKQYNLEWYDPCMVAGKYNMPIITKTDYVPEELIGFNYMLSSVKKNKGIHCFVDDYQFERLWKQPMEYYEKIKEYDCFLSPDFSLYMDMPYAMKIWNVYRSRLIGQIYQNMGIEVIPTINWAEKETFEFCFDGIEQGELLQYQQ